MISRGKELFSSIWLYHLVIFSWWSPLLCVLTHWWKVLTHLVLLRTHLQRYHYSKNSLEFLRGVLSYPSSRIIHQPGRPTLHIHVISYSSNWESLVCCAKKNIRHSRISRYMKHESKNDISKLHCLQSVHDFLSNVAYNKQMDKPMLP